LNRNLSQLSVAVNVGAGARRAEAENSYPVHGDEEEDEPVKPGSSGVYDIRSWLAHKSSRSSGVTGRASVDQMGGVAQFVTQAKPPVERRPTEESAGMGMRMGSGSGSGMGTSSAVATPTTAVQSHVRFPPGAFRITTYHDGILTSGSFRSDHLFVTLESKKTIKVHNLPPPNAHDRSYQDHSVIKAVRNQVVRLWPGGSKEDVEERGEWWVKLGGEGDAWGSDGNGSEGVTYVYGFAPA